MAVRASLFKLSSLSSLRSVSLASRRAWVTTEPKPSTQLVRKDREDVERVNPKDLVNIESTTGLPDDQVGRLARIYQRAPNATQSGTDNTHHWTLEFDNQERWENPLMGWTSSGDPLSNVTLSFNTKEEAIAFAIKSGFTYQISKPQKPIMRRKSYGDNFAWDSKTRVGSK